MYSLFWNGMLGCAGCDYCNHQTVVAAVVRLRVWQNFGAACVQKAGWFGTYYLRAIRFTNTLTNPTMAHNWQLAYLIFFVTALRLTWYGAGLSPGSLSQDHIKLNLLVLQKHDRSVFSVTCQYVHWQYLCLPYERNLQRFPWFCSYC